MHRQIFAALIAGSALGGFTSTASADCGTVSYGQSVLTCTGSISSFVDTGMDWLASGGQAAIADAFEAAFLNYIENYGLGGLSTMYGSASATQSWQSAAPTEYGSYLSDSAYVNSGVGGSGNYSWGAWSTGGTSFPSTGIFDGNDYAYHSVTAYLTSAVFDSVGQVVDVTYTASLSSYIIDYRTDGTYRTLSSNDILSGSATIAVPGPVAGAGLPVLVGFAGAALWRRRRQAAA